MARPIPNVKYNSIWSVATPTERLSHTPLALNFLLLSVCCCLLVLLIRICNQFWVLRALVSVSFDALAISKRGSQAVRTSIRMLQRARPGREQHLILRLNQTINYLVFCVAASVRLHCCLPVACNFYWPHFCSNDKMTE